MNGQRMNYSYSNYLKSLKNTPGPQKLDKTIRIDYAGMISYAKERNVSPSNLSQKEKEMFITRL